MPAIPVVALVGAALISANAQKVAANKAADAQKAALAAQHGVDINSVADTAAQQDMKRYQAQFSALHEIDPTAAQIRDTTNTGLLATAGGDQNSTNANTILQGLFDRNNPVNPTDANFEAALKSKAQQQLDLGGQLSPEAQAEFVRAGLEGTAGAGFRGGSSAQAQGVGKLLFSESNALEQQRQNMAKELFGFATDLNTNRNAQLMNIGAASVAKSNSDENRLLALAQLSDSRVPTIGLTGGDIANLAVGNTNQSNQVALNSGAVAAQQAAARGQIQAGLIGNIGSAAGGLGGMAYNYFSAAPPQTAATTPAPTYAQALASKVPTYSSTQNSPSYSYVLKK